MEIANFGAQGGRTDQKQRKRPLPTTSIEAKRIKTGHTLEMHRRANSEAGLKRRALFDDIDARRIKWVFASTMGRLSARQRGVSVDRNGETSLTEELEKLVDHFAINESQQ